MHHYPSKEALVDAFVSRSSDECLSEIHEHLEPGGRLYVVVISGLRQFIARAFVEVFGNHHKLKQGKQYTVAMAERR